MDGSLDDPLARMHRWEALRQRLAVRRGIHLGPVGEEVVDAVGEVLRRHGPVTVTVTVEDAEALAAVRLAWQDGRLTVSGVDPSVPPEHTGNGHADPSRQGPTPSPDTAARLAELIRRDPWLMEDHDTGGTDG